jgi:thymidylate kinase
LLSPDQARETSCRVAVPSHCNGELAEMPASKICLRLVAALERARIRYCHWKSNVRLAGTLDGTEDIDLLVHPADADRFQRVINSCGFKLAVAPWGAGHPGIFHALAWDPDLGRLLDLHAYHQLISGDSFVKSFRYPVEGSLLERTCMLRGVRVPEPSAELVLFLLRTLLKHTSFVELWKVSKDFGQSRGELAWLLKRADIPRAELWRSDVFPALPVTIQQMVDCVAQGTVLDRSLSGMQIAWALRRERRIGHAAALASRVTRVWRHYARRSRNRRNLSLLSGGAWIALAGPKGSGKSTLAGLLAKRLGSHLDVQTVHLGKPPSGPLSLLPALSRPVLYRLFPKERLREYEKPERRAERRYSTLFIVRKLLLAHDRERLLSHCTRAVASGTIVISDRCMGTDATGLDCSAFDDVAVARARSPLQRWLMNRERSIYRRLPKPRLVLKLEVPITTALIRDRLRMKPGGPDPLAIERRFELERDAEFRGSTVCVINADGQVEQTLRQAMAAIWSSI